MNPYAARINQTLQAMQASNTESLIVASPYNLMYLTGQSIHTGERMSCLLLSIYDSPKLILHEMFAGPLELPGDIDLLTWSDEEDPVALLAPCLARSVAVRVDPSWPSRFLLDLMRAAPQIAFAKSDIVERLRQIKDEREIDLLRQSAKIADAVMHQLLQLQYYPATEREMAETVRSFFNAQQVDELSFRPIIGFGHNSANPHHEIGNAGLQPDQAIVIDLGGIYRGYCSDMTRTVFYGRPDSRYTEIHKIVQDAQEQAIAMVKPGVRFCEIDAWIRSYFAKWGYERYFTHRTGHGIGLELHEDPSLHAGNRELIRAGMAFSIEPGIYLPGEFGVRIEDVVVVTDDGCEVLTSSPREVHIIDLVGT